MLVCEAYCFLSALIISSSLHESAGAQNSLSPKLPQSINRASEAEVVRLLDENVESEDSETPDLQPQMPNVCRDSNPRPRTVHQKYKTPYIKLTKMWEPNCGYPGNWCIRYKQQTHYVTHYKTSVRIPDKDQYRCCPGFIQQPGMEGCVPKSNCSQFVQSAFSCKNGGLCYENNGVVRCSCPAGFTGVHCQIQIDDCASGTGDCQKDCALNPKSSYCRCPAGYFLAPDRRRCLDIDECKYNRGGCMYFCENLPGGYRCACPSDMMLAADKISCVPFFDPCKHPPNGDCEHVCTTLPGYRYVCSCRPGYRLADDKKRCLPHDPCQENNGGCQHDCRVVNGEPHCSCHEGYQVSPQDPRKCTDINECSQDNGGCQHQCRNVDGSYSCECNPGWQLGNDGKTCYRVLLEVTDPCQFGNGGCTHICLRTDSNSAECACRPGYDLQADGRTCRDRDECLTGEAACYGPAVVCVNEIGSYRCECQAGFRLSADGHSCQDIDECLNYNGGCQHKCVNTPGSFQCLCNLGDELNPDGLTCSRSTKYIRDEGFDTSQAIVIGSPGQSRRQINANTRVQESGVQVFTRKRIPVDSSGHPCPAGRFGDDCQLTCSHCENGGRCNRDLTGCDCPSGYQGITCHDMCAPNRWGFGCRELCDCMEGIPCDPNSGVCRCPVGRHGDKCEIAGCQPGYWGRDCDRICPDHCATNQCERDTGQCTCAPGTYGAQCHLSCPEGTWGEMCQNSCSKECRGGKTRGCHPQTGQCICQPGYRPPECILPCPRGYFGMDCRQTCFECTGGCDPVSGKCTIQCPPGKQGPRCEQDCDEGYWGVHCTKRCQCGIDSNGRPVACNPQTGECICKAGYRGARCDIRCEPGTYGPGCEKKCECGLGATACDPVTGLCHCEDGTVGTKCGMQNDRFASNDEPACPPGRWGPKCTKICDCVHGVECNKQTGLCVCFAGYNGTRCDE
ncbi:multiple epidermal growth factor-like domains protein 6, partial [Clonorchis sinensis]